MSVNEFVTFTIQVNNAGVSQQGFGTPLVPSYSATWAEWTRTYSRYADVLADFAAGTPEALAANALFAQSPSPLQVKIGRCSNKPTKQYTIGAITIANSYAYQIQVDGPGITSTLASFTSDGTATKQEIHNGLIAALNAVVGKNYTAAFAPLTYAPQTYTVANQAQGQLTIAAHGLNTGDGPFQLTTTGTIPTGLAAVTNYWAIKVDANTIQLATSLTNALAGTFIVLSSNGTGTNTVNGNTPLSPILPFLVTASAAGNWFSLECIGNAAILSNKESHADPGIQADLTQLALVDEDWYGLALTDGGKGTILQAAAWTEANNKILIVSVVDSDAVNTVAGNGDTLDALATLGYTRTCGKYHPSPLQMFGAASMGRVISLVPGKWTEFGKTLVGVSPVKFTATQRVNLRARRAGSYTTEKGRKITWDGKVFDTVYGYLDIRVAADWFRDACQSAAFGVMVSLDKVAYTDEDIDLIAGAIRGVIADAVSDAHKVLDRGDPNDPTNLPPTVTFPKVSAIAPGTRALRNLPNGTITGRFQGAVQSVAFIATLTF